MQRLETTVALDMAHQAVSSLMAQVVSSQLYLHPPQIQLDHQRQQTHTRYIWAHHISPQGHS